ncbi:MAG TPA: HAMP domain-containing sensor histidine kinase [Actinomycetes bacterium]|nr:HAMP domain-containing sensor histidine kinase [Actinomycetes bacterium]
MLTASRLGVRSSLHGYVLVVALAGLAVLGVAVGQSRATLAHASLALGVLAAMAAVTEVAPVSQNLALPYVLNRTTSTPFVIAVLAQWGGGPAVIVGAASSLIGDLARRRPPRKVAFNLGQYSLMYAVMAVVYRALGASAPFELRARQIAALVVAGAAGAVVNVVVTQVVRRLERGTPLPTTLPRILSSEAQSWAPELGIAVVVLLVSQRMPLLTIALILPLLPIHAAFRAVAEAQARRAEAEAARSEAEAARGQAEQIAEERARLIDARNLLIRRMKEVDHQKDELLASVTHELRTPASSILGVIRTLSQDPGRFSPQEYMELLGLVLEQAEQLDRLIGQLLLAARLQQPHFVTDPTTLEVVDAAILVHRAGQLASLTYPDRPVHVQAGEWEGGRLPVRVDRKVIAQILGNLVGNAAKHTPPGTPIWIDVGRQGNLAVLAVEDGGSGVPPQLRVQVFERFTQLDGHRDGDGGGFGLGLYIARQLARAQGGEVLAVDPSRPGGGARFELRLPLVSAEDAGGAALRADAPSAGGGGGGRVPGGRPAP